MGVKQNTQRRVELVSLISNSRARRLNQVDCTFEANMHVSINRKTSFKRKQKEKEEKEDKKNGKTK